MGVNLRKHALVLGALVAIAGCQATGQLSVAVPSGESRQVGRYYSVHEDCTPYGDVTVRVVKQPSNGTVAIKDGDVYTGFATTNPRYVCNSRPVKGKQVWYTAHDGLIGADSFSLQVIFPDGKESLVDFSVAIK
jgi:hypothetical protein